MKLTTGILAVAMMTGAAWAQNPDAIDNARSVAKSLQQKQANDTSAALDAAGVPASSSKPAPGAPAPAVKPVVIPSSAPAPKPAAKPATASASAAKPAAKPAAAPASASASTKSSTVAAKTSAPAAKAQATSAKPAVAKAPVVSAKAAAPKPAPVKTAANTAKPAAKEAAKDPKPAVAEASKPADAPKPLDSSAKPSKAEDKKWAMNGKRDPFFSPVVQQQGGSNCSTGKKCLEIGQINLRGVVKSDNGFIAVVTNNLNKAYFLRENDPVFNGYVVKITGDSVVFQETVQDKLGKPFNREVVKRIFTPAV